jgi:hypothetical protein
MPSSVCAVLLPRAEGWQRAALSATSFAHCALVLDKKVGVSDIVQ